MKISNLWMPKKYVIASGAMLVVGFIAQSASEGIIASFCSIVGAGVMLVAPARDSELKSR